MIRRNFSLVELLVVIAIIAILAGLITPAVVNGQKKARITQAKSDMAAIKTALKGVENTYQRMVSISSDKAKFDGTAVEVETIPETVDGKAIRQLVLGTDKFADSKENKKGVEAYYAFIRELSVPKELAYRNVNIRNLKFLDPRSDYDKDALETIWQDPWGNPYIIMIDVNGADKVYIPLDGNKKDNDDRPNNKSGKLLLSGNVFIYSFGPNGVDDSSYNAANGGKPNTDDVCSWEQ